MFRYRTIFLFAIILVNISYSNNILIRTNQVGYLINGSKTGVVMSKTSLLGQSFEVVNANDEKVVFKGKIDKLEEASGSYKFNYKIDFSGHNKVGVFKVKVNNIKSYEFKIDNNIYSKVTNDLLEFFKIQRCGSTNPTGHAVCHNSDATSLKINGQVINRQVDVTGGWHDAGDYIKFLNTTAYASYLLLFSYEFDKEKFSFDLNKNGVPDVLEEAKIGLDWMLRCNYEGVRLITEVQDLRDHDYGWRLPEEDQLQYDRPAIVDNGKNIVGIYTATLALAAKIWRDDLNYKEYSDKCLATAKKIYDTRNNVPDIAKKGCGSYIDKSFEGKLALGAIELYETTNTERYLKEAKVYADSAGSDFWWSYGDINALPHYKIAKYEKRYADYIKMNLLHFSGFSNKNLFGVGLPYSWGTNNAFMGISLQAILYKKLTGSKQFDNLAESQRDFILGKNQWGISFIYKAGTNYSKNLHHQISYLNKTGLTGGFAAGPVTQEFLRKYNLKFESSDNLSSFQTKESVYKDDRNDYITNEPTIGANATAIFVFGYFTK